MMLRPFTRLVLSFALASSFLFLSASANAQNLGGASVSGVVQDDTGYPLPGVTVTAARAG